MESLNIPNPVELLLEDDELELEELLLDEELLDEDELEELLLDEEELVLEEETLLEEEDPLLMISSTGTWQDANSKPVRTTIPENRTGIRKRFFMSYSLFYY